MENPSDTGFSPSELMANDLPVIKQSLNVIDWKSPSIESADRIIVREKG